MADTTVTLPIVPEPIEAGIASNVNQESSSATAAPRTAGKADEDYKDDNKHNQDEDSRKRKHDGGSRSGRGGKRRDMGRKEYQYALSIPKRSKCSHNRLTRD